MVAFRSKSTSDVVTIGDFSAGFPVATTWGRGISTPDLGRPLLNLQPIHLDPWRIWKSQPSVRKVVSFAAEQFASIPWHAYLRNSDNDRYRDSESPLEALLQNPNPRSFKTGYNLMRDLAVDRMMYDVWCVVLGTDADGRDKLVRIPPRLLEIRSDFLGEVRQILFHAQDGALVDMTDAPMAISWGWSAEAAGGVSPLITLGQLLVDYTRSVEWRNQVWDNGPKFTGILNRPSTARQWDETKRERFLTTWAEWRDGNKRGTPVLEDGMTYETFDGIEPDKVRDIEIRQATDIEVCSVFHIAPELVGAREGTFSNISAFRQMLFGPTLGPMFAEFKQTINAQLVPLIDSRKGVYVEMDRESAMNGSFFEQAKILSTAIGGPWMTRNEARGKTNLPSLPGGDDLITPLNVTAGGQASPQDSGTQNEGDGTSGDGTAPPTVAAAATRQTSAAKLTDRLGLAQPSQED